MSQQACLQKPSIFMSFKIIYSVLQWSQTKQIKNVIISVYRPTKQIIYFFWDRLSEGLDFYSKYYEKYSNN